MSEFRGTCFGGSAGRPRACSRPPRSRTSARRPLKKWASLALLIPDLLASDGGGVDFVFPLLLPILYAVVGALMGAIGAVVYNWIARWLGGIEMDLTEADGPVDASPRESG